MNKKKLCEALVDLIFILQEKQKPCKDSIKALNLFLKNEEKFLCNLSEQMKKEYSILLFKLENYQQIKINNIITFAVCTIVDLLK